MQDVLDRIMHADTRHVKIYIKEEKKVKRQRLLDLTSNDNVSLCEEIQIRFSISIISLQIVDKMTNKKTL